MDKPTAELVSLISSEQGIEFEPREWVSPRELVPGAVLYVATADGNEYVFMAHGKRGINIVGQLASRGKTTIDTNTQMYSAVAIDQALAAVQSSYMFACNRPCPRILFEDDQGQQDLIPGDVYSLALGRLPDGNEPNQDGT
ncbi:hypothetical protein HY441_01940 [Candidatus Microgenomates bacterium]|nr:hypothetical protein [Candidatus Microgenomates bacterium]